MSHTTPGVARGLELVGSRSRHGPSVRQGRHVATVLRPHKPRGSQCSSAARTEIVPSAQAFDLSPDPSLGADFQESCWTGPARAWTRRCVEPRVPRPGGALSPPSSWGLPPSAEGTGTAANSGLSPLLPVRAGVAGALGGTGAVSHRASWGGEPGAPGAHAVLHKRVPVPRASQ